MSKGKYPIKDAKARRAARKQRKVQKATARKAGPPAGKRKTTSPARP